jgi:hypothetical protein
MKTKVLRSQATATLELDVQAHADELAKWRDHMARVKADKENGVPVHLRHMPYPQPATSPLIARCVDENGAPNFEIVEDGPAPDRALEAKKIALTDAVTRIEAAAIAAIIPERKRRYLEMTERDIRAADQERMQPILARSREIARLHRIAQRKLRESPDDKSVQAEVEALEKESNDLADSVDQADPFSKGRPRQHQNFLDAQKQRNDRRDAIMRWAAKAHSDIEDLTAKNIDGWLIPAPPTF